MIAQRVHPQNRYVFGTCLGPIREVNLLRVDYKIRPWQETTGREVLDGNEGNRMEHRRDNLLKAPPDLLPLLVFSTVYLPVRDMKYIQPSFEEEVLYWTISLVGPTKQFRKASVKHVRDLTARLEAGSWRR